MSQQINSIVQDLMPKQHHWKIQLFQQWQAIIGRLHGRVRIEKIYDNILVLGVCHPSWAQELYMLSDILKQKINAVLDKERIQKIRFQIVSNRDDKKRTSGMQKTDSTITTSFSATTNVTLSVTEETLLATVENDELRDAIKQYYLRCREQKPMKRKSNAL